MSSYFTYILILVALTVGLTVQQIPDFDVQSFKDNLNWTQVNLEHNAHPDLTHAIESLINGGGEAFFSITKWVAQFSSENPTIPFKLLIYITILSILAPIILVLFKLLVIIFLLIREKIESSRDKRELKKIKDGNK